MYRTQKLEQSTQIATLCLRRTTNISRLSAVATPSRKPFQKSSNILYRQLGGVSSDAGERLLLCRWDRVRALPIVTPARKVHVRHSRRALSSHLNNDIDTKTRLPWLPYLWAGYFLETSCLKVSSVNKRSNNTLEFLLLSDICLRSPMRLEKWYFVFHRAYYKRLIILYPFMNSILIKKRKMEKNYKRILSYISIN